MSGTPDEKGIEMGKKNVLLLGVSPLTRLQGNRYTYEWKQGKPINLEGILTNEAPAKAVISKLYRNGERLDRVVMLCTDEVRKPIWVQIPPEPEKDGHNDKETTGDRIVQDTLRKLSGNLNDLSTAEYYQEVIRTYARENKPKKQAAYSIEFDMIPVEDYTDKDDISRAVIAAARSVEAAGDEILNSTLRRVNNETT